MTLFTFNSRAYQIGDMELANWVFGFGSLFELGYVWYIGLDIWTILYISIK